MLQSFVIYKSCPTPPPKIIKFPLLLPYISFYLSKQSCFEFYDSEKRKDLPYPIIYSPKLFQGISAYPPNIKFNSDFIIVKVFPLLSHLA